MLASQFLFLNVKPCLTRQQKIQMTYHKTKQDFVISICHIQIKMSIITYRENYHQQGKKHN